uniref:Uncharacterized protein n=1 Tax=Anguilla anguilla TaxID=7936 RepID=A0A0E9V2U4_ANGAN
MLYKATDLSIQKCVFPNQIIARPEYNSTSTNRDPARVQ